MKRVIVAVIEVDDDPTDDGYPYEPSKLRAAVVDPDGFDTFLAAAEVGLEGRNDDDLDIIHAGDLLAALKTEETA